MKKRAKKHNHLKRLYREEAAQEPTKATEVLSAAEQRWLRFDLGRSSIIVLLLLTVIAIIKIYESAPFITNLSSTIAQWGGF